MVAIVGPTAVGKSAVAHRVATLIDAEIISADSMQVYRGMDVGTAKPSRDDQIPYHCIDLVDPGTPFSAAAYQVHARKAIEEISDRGRLPILVGGTGLYVRAALEDFRFPVGSVDSPLRIALEEEAHRAGPEGLYERLKAVDPHSAALIHPNNVRRVVRALELAEAGESYSERSAQFDIPKDIYRTVRFGLSMERAMLYSAIDSRVQRMLSDGLMGEVDSLVRAGYVEAITSLQAIGYKELIPVLDGRTDLESASAQIAQATRRYAKRQLSWFRRDSRIHWLDMTNNDVDTCAEQIVAAVADEGSVL